MGRRIKNNSPAVLRRDDKSLGRLVRGIFISLAIPSLMTACAPAPHSGPGSGPLAGGSGRTILYVGSGGKHADTEGQSEASEGAPPSQGGVSLPEQYGPPAPDFPPAGKLTSQHRASRDAQSYARWHASALAKLRAVQTASLTPPPMVKVPKDGIWDRVRKHLMLTAYEHESIQAEVDKIKRSPGTLNFISKRAEPFLFYVVDEIDRRGLPMDLAMVPMVESAFEPTAVSPKQAAGIWQFIPGTATNNGLRLVDGYDGRYDLYAATKAALKYLSHLQGLFGGDWLLALAAYNAGEGCVQRAIQANQKAGLGTSFWDLNLPAETKAYVPKVLALSRVIADPATHGVSLRKISILPYLARVEVQTTTVPLAETVAGLGMSWEEFYGQNPAFKPDVVPGTSFNLLLPLDKAQMLVASLQGSKLIAARKYVVKKGETLTVIAKQQGVTALKLAEWNGLQTDSRVKPGQELIIYPV
jgi:membrane-bound lytic murein transglycosylase D